MYDIPLMEYGSGSGKEGVITPRNYGDVDLAGYRNGTDSSSNPQHGDDGLDDVHFAIAETNNGVER
jgi:hypothetical protein